VEKPQKIRLTVAVLMFVALVGTAFYKVWPLLFPQPARLAPLDPACDLRAGPCVGRLPGGGTITFGVQPTAIPMMEPLTLDVSLEGILAQRVEVDFVGVEMNMGFNRPALEAAGGGRYQGQGMLPVCVRDAMEWEARVLAHTDQGLVMAPFRFITVKPGVPLPGG
jgi:hypothetical protein